ncbi:hypothetical protein K1719_005182 [Acacia pycnantha]|nr:hypothetical protein K1719_005182 [Acacia pycnantha]
MLHPIPFEGNLKNDPPPHPGEDQSSKRAKIDEGQMSDINMDPGESQSPIDHVPETQMSPPTVLSQDTLMGGADTEVVTPQIPSFKDKLLNSEPMEEEEEDIVLNQGDVSIDLNGKIPTVDFASHVIETLNQKMGLTVVVKLLGRRIGYRHLRSQLQSLWKPSGQFKLIDLHDDCFLVRFQDDLDYQHALLTGPWMIFGHYLTVQPWTPAFRPQDHVVNQVDYNTDSGDRGKFARIAVVIDLTKPLISKIQVDGELIYVEYEGLPSICFECGRYGHLQISCPTKMVAATVPPPSSDSPMAPVAEARETAEFGAWMQFQRRRRNVVRGNKPISASNGKNGVNGSRFEVLRDSLNEEAQKSDDPGKSIQILNKEISNGKKAVKETRGAKKAVSGSGIKLPSNSLQDKTHDNITNSQLYVVRRSDTSLDQSTNSVIQIEDQRMPKSTHSSKGKKSGPGPLKPTIDHNPPSRVHGLNLSSGVNIHKLGSKPNSEGAGPSVLSDHRPIAICAEPPNRPGSPPPFRFLAPWITHPEFQGIVQRNWNSGNDILTCIDDFKIEIQNWNSSTFGGIGQRKRKLLRWLNGIQTKLELHPDASSDFLLDLEVSLREDLEEVCFQEELLWLQKSSSDWVCLGDRNTGYYHLKALLRKKKNYVSQLKTSDGTWLRESDHLASYARQFFVDLFSLENPSVIQFPLHGAFPKLAPHLLLSLDSGHYLTLEIILAVLAAMGRTLLGVELEPQFNKPCLSSSPQDFWKRWNVMDKNILKLAVYDPSSQCL